MGSFSKYRLRWNNHLSNFVGSLGPLLKSENYSDVTVYCEGHVWHLHRLVLSASSNHFDQLLNSIPIGLTPGIILDGPSPSDVEAIIQFIYHGEVSIHQDLLQSLLRTASSLKIKGLADVSLVNADTPEDCSLSLNYNQSSNGKRIFHVRPDDVDKPVTTLSEIYEMSPLNLSRHQSTISNKLDSVEEERYVKGAHKRLAYFQNEDYQRESSYDNSNVYRTNRTLDSPPFKKLRSANMISEQQLSPRNMPLMEEIPYDLSTGGEKEIEKDNLSTKLEIKEEDNQTPEGVAFDSINSKRILHISSSDLSPQIIESYEYPLNNQSEVVHLVHKDHSSADSPNDKSSLPNLRPESGNYIHIKKRITNLEKLNYNSVNHISNKKSDIHNDIQENDVSKSPTYTDASVGPSEEITETFSHKKFSHCTILSSGDSMHVVRGLYNQNLLNGSSYKVLNAKSNNLGDNSPVKKLTAINIPTTTFSGPNNVSVVPVKQESNANNSSMLLVSSTSQSIHSPISSDLANSPGSKSEDKSAGEGSDNDACIEGGILPASGSSSDGTGQGSQRVTINMRTFKEEWRRQLLVDYDSRTNMSICMLCFTTFKSYDGPRKNTYVKHAKRFHPALDEYSDEEREVIINMYEKYHKYDIDMQKEINKSFRTPNGPGCVSKRSGKIIDAAGLANCVQNNAKLTSLSKDVTKLNCDWPDKFCSKPDSETDEVKNTKNIKENVPIKSVISSSEDVQFSNISGSNFILEKSICSGTEDNSTQMTRRKSG